MPNRLVSALPVMFASGACCLAACGGHDGGAPAQRAGAPPTERPLLGPPDPTGPTTRGIFLKDPDGQIETIAAGGHLVAWTVRTPADALPTGEQGSGAERRPRWLPRSTKIVIADERGGDPITVDLDRRWVTGMRMVRGAQGPAAPQLAIESCTSRARSTCKAELLTLTPAAPLSIIARSNGPAASAALNGLLDSGRRLKVASPKRASCTPRLSVREQSGSVRVLPPLPARERTYPRCVGLTGRLIVGDYAFAWVRRTAPKYHFDADFVYGISLAAGPSARWRDVQHPYRSSPGSTGLAIGPAVTDHALYWEETDEEADDGSIYSLKQVALPRDVLDEQSADTPTTADPIAPGAANACDIAATDDAIYELANPRCTIGYGKGTGGQIRRIANATFHPDEN